MEETLKLILEKLSSLEQGQADLKQSTTQLKLNQEKLNQDFARFEDKVDNKLSALFDGYKQHTDTITTLKENIDKLVANQERQDVEIKVIHTKVQ